VLLGVNGFLKRVELNKKRGTAGPALPLNPYDKNSHVYGKPTEVISDEFVEPSA
jgi:hypothetical protein